MIAASADWLFQLILEQSNVEHRIDWEEQRGTHCNTMPTQQSMVG